MTIIITIIIRLTNLLLLFSGCAKSPGPPKKLLSEISLGQSVRKSKCYNNNNNK